MNIEDKAKLLHERFLNLYALQKTLQTETISSWFNEREIKAVLDICNEVLTIYDLHKRGIITW